MYIKLWKTIHIQEFELIKYDSISCEEIIVKLNTQLAEMIDNGELDCHQEDEIAITVCGECTDDGQFMLGDLYVGLDDGGTHVYGNKFCKTAKEFVFEKPEDLINVIYVHVEFAIQEFKARGEYKETEALISHELEKERSLLQDSNRSEYRMN